MNLVPLKEKLERFQARAKSMREKAKEGTALITETIVGAATAAALGALDQAKGTVPASSVAKLSYYSVGPVPAFAIAAGIGKVAALGMIGSEFQSRTAAAVGQAGVDVGSYLGGREMWARHQAGSSTPAASP